MNCYKTTTQAGSFKCLNVKVTDMVVPLPPTPIEFSPQFTRDGLQMHEVAEATTSAFPAERRQLVVRAKKKKTWQENHTRGVNGEHIPYANVER